jgi:dephospho-CoA kinase
MCDLLIMVDTPRELRRSRARARGWSDAEFARREAAQWPVDEKRRQATVTVANASTETELRDAVREIWGRQIVR